MCVRASPSSVCLVKTAGEVAAAPPVVRRSDTLPQPPPENDTCACPEVPGGDTHTERGRSYGVPNPGPNLPVGSGPSNMGSNLVRGNVCVCTRPPALSASLPPSDQPTHHRDIGKLLSKARFEPEGRSSIRRVLTTAPSVPGRERERERDVSLGCLTSIKCTRHACVWRGLKLMCGMSGGTYPMGSCLPSM